jgi:CRISPR/Cas system Type II protein with McrA/HNH and RuvC-like nuclease domain
MKIKYDWVTPKKDPPKHNKRVGIGNTLRFEIFMRDNFTCQYCGVNKEEDGVKLEVDHIVPVSKGGTNKESNLTTACFSCNRGKRNKIVPDTTVLPSPKIVSERLRDASLRSTEIDLSFTDSSITTMAARIFDTSITTRASGR